MSSLAVSWVRTVECNIAALDLHQKPSLVSYRLFHIVDLQQLACWIVALICWSSDVINFPISIQSSNWGFVLKSFSSLDLSQRFWVQFCHAKTPCFQFSLAKKMAKFWVGISCRFHPLGGGWRSYPASHAAEAAHQDLPLQRPAATRIEQLGLWDELWGSTTDFLSLWILRTKMDKKTKNPITQILVRPGCCWCWRLFFSWFCLLVCDCQTIGAVNSASFWFHIFLFWWVAVACGIVTPSGDGLTDTLTWFLHLMAVITPFCTVLVIIEVDRSCIFCIF